MRLRRLLPVAAGATLMAGLAGCGGQQDEPAPEDQPDPADFEGPLEEDPEDLDEDEVSPQAAATGTFHDPQGEEAGTVEVVENGTATEVRVQVHGLEPGFRGLHIHGIGECEPDSADPEDPQETGDFLSAGPHLNPEDVDHGEHAGDLPPLLVMDDGAATLTTLSDRFTPADLLDEDGTAFMVHSDPDNFAHIPERYGERDSDTLDTGDAGDRVACAVVQ